MDRLSTLCLPRHGYRKCRSQALGSSMHTWGADGSGLHAARLLDAFNESCPRWLPLEGRDCVHIISGALRYGHLRMALPYSCPWQGPGFPPHESGRGSDWEAPCREGYMQGEVRQREVAGSFFWALNSGGSRPRCWHGITREAHAHTHTSLRWRTTEGSQGALGHSGTRAFDRKRQRECPTGGSQAGAWI